MTTVIQYIVDAVGTGSIYALLALSLALLFSVMGLMNFAYGELIMIGGYTMYFLRDAPWPVLIVGTIAAVTLASLLMERLAFRPVRHADLTTLLVTSFAVSVALQALALMLMGPVPKGVRPFETVSGAWLVGGVHVGKLDVAAAAMTVALLVCLSLILKRTMLGIQLRASTENFQTATCNGVRGDRVISTAFAITGVLGGAAALVLIAKQGSVSPTVGFASVLIAFVGAVIGGLGGLVPAAVGGFFLGCLTTVLQGVLPVSVSVYTQAFVFGMVLLVLVVRPQGLAGRSSTRGV